MKTPLEDVAEALQQATRVLIATHVNPDGDALGSAVAIAHIASAVKADARLFLPKTLPVFLSWMPLPVPSVATLKSLEDWQPDCIVFVDCGDANRAGPEMAELAAKACADPANPVTINIDHHLSNPCFARVNWVESERSATGELVGKLAEHLGLPLSGNLGQAIFLALSSDTGSFSYANTTADCFSMAARIVANGLDVGLFTDLYENNWSINRMYLWGRVTSEISLHYDGALAVIAIPSSYLVELGLGKADLEGFASSLRRIKSVRVGVLLREDDDKLCKISLRSMGDVDVRAVAAYFGGGGHAAAAGAELHMALQEAIDAVIEQVAAIL